MNFDSVHAGKKTIPKIASERLLVKGGTVVNHDLSFRADVFIENGKIRQVGTDLTIPGGVTIVDAKGALVLPGGIDLSTNFDSFAWPDGDSSTPNMKTVDNFYSGTRAALIGGTTTVLDFATGDKGRLMTSFKEKFESCSTSCCDVGLHVDVTSWNDEVKQSMTTLATKHGVNSFRVHTSDRWHLNDEELYDVLEHIKSLEGIALVHAENGALIRKTTENLKNAKNFERPEAVLLARNEDVEYDAVNKILIIAKQIKCPLFFLHVTGKKAMNCIIQARAEGYPVYSQVLAVSFYRDGSVLRDASWNRAVSCFTHPPLRDDSSAIKRQLSLLSNGTVQCVSSGHCVFSNTDKAALGKNDFSKIPPGCNGVYERMMALWSTAVNTGYIDQNQFVSMTSTNAARLFNLFPQKGIVAVGSDADLVVWKSHQQLMLSQSASALNVTKADCSNAFDGLEVDSSPSIVICHGRIVFDENQVSVVQSMGKYSERSSGSPFVYNRLRLQDKTSDQKTQSDTPTNKSSSNGSTKREEKTVTNEVPERFTRSSGIRAMHQSGWSFSGETNDADGRKNTRFTKPAGGCSNFRLL